MHTEEKFGQAVEVKDENDVFEILDHKYPEFVAEVARLNRKAGKLGLPQMMIEEVGSYRKTIRIFAEYTPWYEKPQHMDVTVLVHQVKVAGPSLKIGGWSFVAKLEHSGEFNIIKNITENDLPEAYRTSDATCDHCGLVRGRKETFVLVNNETGEYKQVGSTCLVDFLGHPDAVGLADHASNWRPTLHSYEELEDEDLSFGKVGGSAYISTAKYIASVKVAIAESGWKSSKVEFGNPTKYQALGVLFDHKVKLTDDQVEDGKKILAEVHTHLDEKVSLNDYEHNLWVLSAKDVISFSEVGYVASIYPFYQRVIEGKIFDKKAQVASEFVGEVGGKIEDVHVTVISIKVLNNPYNRYSNTYLYNMVDDNGNLISWFSSNELEAEEGEGMTIAKGTVKAHNVFNGHKQTIVTRCKVA